jgi:TRAP-type C4-dicarboxylate transport system permease small subunit
MIGLRWLDRGLAACDHAFNMTASALLGVMLAANVANMAYRAVFDTTFPLVWPWTMVLFVWSTFLGFYVLYRRGRDVVVDYCIRGLGPGGRRAIRLFVSGVGLATMGVLLWIAPYRLATQAGIIELVGLPRFTLSVPFFASCLLIFLNCLVEAIGVASGDGTPPRRPAETQAKP